MSAGSPTGRWAWAEIDSDAIRHNVAAVVERVAPARVWAIVKANGYGHGAVTAARAALAGGATGLGVALTEEGTELRRAGLTGVPILVLSQQPPDQIPELLDWSSDPDGVRPLGRADGRRSGPQFRAPRRAGASQDRHRDAAGGCSTPTMRSRSPAPSTSRPRLRLEGVFTHLAMADEPDDPATDGQLDRFDGVLATLAAAGIRADLVHAANSAGGLAHPRARRDLVRVGIAAYGIEPGPGVAPWSGELRPAMRLVARVSYVKSVVAGDRISYGLRHEFDRDTTVATVPIGYADGVPAPAVARAAARC